MTHAVEIAVVAGIVLLAIAYLVRGALKRFRGRSCGGGSCACGDAKGVSSKPADLTVKGRPVHD